MAASRPTFDSMDFAADETGQPVKYASPVQAVKNVKSTKSLDERKDKKKKRKKHSLLLQDAPQMDRAVTAFTPTATVNAATASTASKKEDGLCEKNAAQSDKKRKREKQGHTDTFSNLHKSSGGEGLIRVDMMQNIQSSVNAAGEAFHRSTAATKPGEESSKKKRKDKTGRKSNETIDFDRMAKETRAIDKRARKEKRAKRHSTSGEQTRLLAAAPLAAAPLAAAPLAVPSPTFASLPRKTPIPLPQNAFSHAVNAMKADRIGRKDSRLLALESPQPQAREIPASLPDSPIPFSLTGTTKKKDDEKSEEVVTSSPTPVEDESPSPAASGRRTDRLEHNSDGRTSLSTSNLMRHMTTTQPLSRNGKAKPVPKATSAAASTAGSTTSGGTTPSIKQLFAHVGKPYSRSGAEVDPFVRPEVKKKAARESHEEANSRDFTARYHAAQKSVNFSDEREYHAQATAWRAANDALGPLPCLGLKASGCSSKREHALHLSKHDGSRALRDAYMSEAEHAALHDATQRASAAEQLLCLAIAARVPVATGSVEGTWKLFSSAYAASHVDKYGAGQRTLTIFSVAGGTTTTTTSSSSSSSSFPSCYSASASPVYTARLRIPPRSMLFSLRPFHVPPHASFRATTLRTTDEGYKMEVVFVGNGYLLLRMDLSLLLSGKGMQNRAGKGVVMEFVGVHERAVVWGEGEGEDELEVVGRKLFAKYDGEA